MGELFTLANLGTLAMLVLLQAVLGFDNLLYISLESKRAPLDKQSYVRKMGIGMAIFLRIALMFVLVKLVAIFQKPLFNFDNAFVEGHVNGHSLIVLAGGLFIIYTSIKEIWHMMSIESHAEAMDTTPKSTTSIIAMIMTMNVVFSFDSILSAMALTKDPETGLYNVPLMATAIVIGGILMIVLAEKVANFLQKNRMYEVLGLFVLFVVGIMLISEGGHLAHLKFFGYEIVAMNKATFYFVIVSLLLVDIVQGRYQRKIIAEENHKAKLLEEQKK